jgi:hypothetical protein
LGGSTGDTLAVGAHNQSYNATGGGYAMTAGAVYVYTRSGSTWSLQQKIVGEGTNARLANDQFGVGVALGGTSGDTLAVGASGQDYDAAGAFTSTDVGAVFVYH